MANRDPLEEEFREFVAGRSAALLRTAYLLAGDWATAEDLLQTTLTKTYLAWRRLGGIEAVEPYARRVLVNTATSWWRRRWHGERPTEVLPERAGADELERQLDRDLLWRHLSALPTRQRAVLVLRFYEDMSEAQTAALLGISTGTVKSQTARALTTLRRRMGAALDLPHEGTATPAGTDRALRAAVPRAAGTTVPASREPTVTAAGTEAPTSRPGTRAGARPAAGIRRERARTEALRPAAARAPEPAEGPLPAPPDRDAVPATVLPGTPAPAVAGDQR
ncbi:SigE family RNA polymerase sigma factor [Micromonospora globbae]|uniref:SigE family RNA polymerase sigma factor n=1 Tax=Micromonospora globbae TaxID=1894969 RepID=UPI0037B7CCBC